MCVFSNGGVERKRERCTGSAGAWCARASRRQMMEAVQSVAGRGRGRGGGRVQRCSHSSISAAPPAHQMLARAAAAAAREATGATAAPASTLLFARWFASSPSGKGEGRAGRGGAPAGVDLWRCAHPSRAARPRHHPRLHALRGIVGGHYARAHVAVSSFSPINAALLLFLCTHRRRRRRANAVRLPARQCAPHQGPARPPPLPARGRQLGC